MNIGEQLNNQDIVIFLGAGASCNSGAPVMTDFLNKAEDIVRFRLPITSTEYFERVFRGWHLLRQTQASVQGDMNNIEHVFGAFEMARIVGRLGDCEDFSEINRTYQSMMHVISDTLVCSQKFPFERGDMQAPEEYRILAQMCKRFLTKPSFRAPRTQLELPTLFTTNYDCALDYSLQKENVPYDYGFRDSGIPRGQFPLLKLHGSLNWFLCPKCVEFCISMINPEIHQSHPPPVGGEQMVRFKRMTGLCVNCEDYRRIDAFTEPFLVPPTWRKADSGMLARVWRQAALALSRAKYILFIGYSFPETDDYMRYLLSLGLSGGPRMRRIVNINPDHGLSTERLKSMLAPTLASQVESSNRRFDNKIADVLIDFFTSASVHEI